MFFRCWQWRRHRRSNNARVRDDKQRFDFNNPINVVIPKLTELILLLTILITTDAGRCPPDPITSPCRCKDEDDQHSEIRCSDELMSPTDGVGQLKSVFSRLNDWWIKEGQSISKDPLPTFQTLWISNGLLDVLDEETTGKVQFAEIWILAKNLSKIHCKAFAGTAETVKKFIIYSEMLDSYPAPYNLFDLLNSFTNVKVIDVQPSKIKLIPSKAFGQLNDLRHLTFGYSNGYRLLPGNDSLTIGDFAFQDLARLNVLSFPWSRINRISKNALNFRNKSEKRLRVQFYCNNLDSTSFADGSLSNFNRPTTLQLASQISYVRSNPVDLDWNQIDFLKQSVFKPFLDADPRNRIESLDLNPLNCSDCRNYWLVVGRDNYERRVKDAFCDGDEDRPLFQADWGQCRQWKDTDDEYYDD